MKRINIVLLSIFLLSIYGCGFLGITNTKHDGEKFITPALSKQYIDYLASDSMKGRNTPSPELDTAAKFIARNFESAGILPVNGSYFQKVKMGIISLGKDNFLRIKKGKEETSLRKKFRHYSFIQACTRSYTQYRMK